MSAGSKGTLLGGGLLYSFDTREGEYDIVRVSDPLEDGLYAGASG